MKKIFKCKNLFLVTFLAIAGFFSGAAISLNKLDKDTSIVEKAEARNDSDWLYLTWTGPIQASYQVTWDTAGASTVRVHMFNSSNTSQNNGWPGETMKKISDSLYAIKINHSYYDKVIFTRTDGNPDHVWNRSTNDGKTAISIPSDLSTNNCFRMVKADQDSYSNCGSWVAGPTYTLIGYGGFNKGTAWSKDDGLSLGSDSSNIVSVKNVYMSALDVFQVRVDYYNSRVGYFGWGQGSGISTTYFREAHYNMLVTTESAAWGDNQPGYSQTNYPDVNGGSGYLGAAGATITYYLKAYSWWYENGFSYGGIHAWSGSNNDWKTATALSSGSGFKYYQVDGVNSGWSYEVYRNNGGGNDAKSTTFTQAGNNNVVAINAGYYDIFINNDGKLAVNAKTTFNPCDSVYLNLNSCWSGQTPKVHIWNSAHTGEAKDITMTEVHGHDSGNVKIYEAKIPSLASADPNYVIFYYGSYTKQTNDLQFTMGSNQFKLTSDGSGGDSKATGIWEKQVSYFDRAEYFGKYFNTCVVCNGESITTDNWSSAKTEYGNMNEKAQYHAWEVDGDSSSAKQLPKAMSKYDYIIHKYSAKLSDDFINRHTRSQYSAMYGAIRSYSPFTLIMGDDGADASVILIIVMSSISILSITALSVLLVKKRKSKEQ